MIHPLWSGVLAIALAAVPQPLDRLVAVVDRDIMTASQLLIEIRVALLQRAGVSAARQARLPPAVGRQALPADRAADELAQQLQSYVIDQRLVAGQVRRQGATGVSDADVAERLGVIQNIFADGLAYQKFLDEFGISPGTLQEIVRRDLANEHFIASRLAPRAAVGADLEVPLTTPLAGASPPALPGDDAATDAPLPRAPVRQDVLADWLAQLRQHVEIRLLGKSGRLELQRPLQVEERPAW